MDVLVAIVLMQVSMAPHRGARLAWARGESSEACVGPIALADDVKARLGWDPFVLPSDIEIEGVVTRGTAGYRADLAFRDAHGKSLGTRRLVGRDCRSVGEAAAIAITLAIDPDAKTERAPAPDIEPPKEPPVIPAPPPIEPARGRVRTTLGGGITGGLVPGPSDVYAFRTTVVLGDRIELGGGVSWFRDASEADLSFGLVAAEVRGCALPWGPEGALRFCGAGMVGAFSSTVLSPALAPVEVGSAPWVGIEVGPFVSLELVGPLRLEGGLGLIVPITRRQGFVRGTSEPVWEQSPLGGRAEMGLGILL